jgi:hypothetical protein
MNATRSRLIRLGLVRPNTSGSYAASQAKAIGARRHELQRTVAVTSKRSINNPLAQV